MPFSVAVVLLIAVVSAVVIAASLVWASLRRRARRTGYGSLGAYLQAPPRTDLEKQDAVDLTMKGVVICLLGVVFVPLLVIGLFPLFFGARKMAYASMGLGLVDDGDAPRA